MRWLFYTLMFKGKFVSHKFENNIGGYVVRIHNTDDGYFAECRGQLSWEPVDVIEKCTHKWSRKKIHHRRSLILLDTCKCCSKQRGFRVWANWQTEISPIVAQHLCGQEVRSSTYLTQIQKDLL